MGDRLRAHALEKTKLAQRIKFARGEQRNVQRSIWIIPLLDSKKNLTVKSKWLVSKWYAYVCAVDSKTNDKYKHHRH